MFRLRCQFENSTDKYIILHFFHLYYVLKKKNQSLSLTLGISWFRDFVSITRNVDSDGGITQINFKGDKLNNLVVYFWLSKTNSPGVFFRRFTVLGFLKPKMRNKNLVSLIWFEVLNLCLAHCTLNTAPEPALASVPVHFILHIEHCTLHTTYLCCMLHIYHITPSQSRLIWDDDGGKIYIDLNIWFALRT